MKYVITSEERSNIMRSIHSTNTSPEIIVRKLLYSKGYRYRLHKRDLPGKPDIVFISRKKVIFVNGCFWHGHNCERGARTPKTNIEYWSNKISKNILRDAGNQIKLKTLGWQLLVIWECELRNNDKLSKKVIRFLDGK